MSQNPQSPGHEELRERLHVLRRRWWLILLGAVIGLSAGHVRGRQDEPQYRAEATVQRHDDGAALGPMRSLGASSPNLVSEIEILRSNAVLRSVVDSLELYRVPLMTDSNGVITIDPEDAVGALQRGMSIVQVPSTNLIRISYRDTDPERSAAVVNAVIGVYQALSARQAREEAMRRREIIAEQLAQVADSLAAVQQVFADYQAASGTLNPADEGGAVAATYVQTENQVRALRFDETVLAGLEAALAEPDPSADDLRRVVIVARDLVPIGSELYGRLQEYETERSQLTAARSGLTREAARVQVLDSLIAATKSDIRSATVQSLAALRTRLAAAEDRLAELSAQLAAYPERASAFSRMRQRTQAVQSTYDMLASKYYEALIAEQVETGKVEVLDAATVPRAPLPSNPQRALIMGLLLGAGAAVALAFLLQALDRKVRTPDDVERATGLRVLGGIPYLPAVKKGKASALVMLARDGTPAPEAFRMLRASMEYARAERPRVVAVTSPGPREGKSFVAANFAIARAKQGAKVLLIDADMRRGSLHRLYGIPSTPGLSDLLVGQDAAPISVERDGLTNLRVLPMGTRAPNPAELLGSQRFEDLVQRELADCDLIVLDTPPALAVADTSALLPHLDGVLVVARSEETDLGALGHAVEMLRQLGAPLLGVVLNGIRRHHGAHGAFGSRYGYYGYTYTDYYLSQNGHGTSPADSRVPVATDSTHA